VQAAGARRTFGDYSEFFAREKAKHPATQEAKDMEEEVAKSHDYARRIANCCRLFFKPPVNRSVGWIASRSGSRTVRFSIL
jgi:hypothetical protein